MGLFRRLALRHGPDLGGYLRASRKTKRMGLPGRRPSDPRFSFILLLALAIEGILCLFMAAPIALPLAAVGGWVGYLIQNRTLRQPIARRLGRDFPPDGL